MRIFGIVLRTVTVLVLGALAPDLATRANAFELARTRALVNHLSAVKPVSNLEKIAWSGTQHAISAEPRLDSALARRWAHARARIRSEADWLNSCDRGACRDPRAEIWARTVAIVRDASFHTRPAVAQQLFNRNIRYAADRRTDDHWATPLQTLLRGAGDCEDHVLLKRAVLMSSGYQETATKLLILETADGIGHMVLHVDGRHPIILDNRFRRPVSSAALKGDRLAAVAADSGYFSVLQ